ncbi:unnamed protein product [Nezara viridula]|uniref:Uncharacterized protein n=1 Tax=Nezara viridula TaxID=85310 RepID=A0A9P0EAE6_NEZVI|nr:unnamed protein product [Nezara viridula]
MIHRSKKVTKSINDVKNNCIKQMKISPNKSKSLRSKIDPAYPPLSKPALRKENDPGQTKKIKLTDTALRDVRHLSETDLISNSTAVFKKLTSHSKQKKESFVNNKNKESDTNLTPKLSQVLDGLMEKLVEMRNNYEESLQTVKSLGDLMEEISTDFKALSRAMNDNVYLLHHNTIQKFHALENRERKMFKNYHVIEYMVNKFGDELEKTRKNLNVIHSKQ